MLVRTIHLVSVTWLLAVGWFVALPLRAQVPADLQQTMRERDRAVNQADAATWDRLTSDEFTLVDENGKFMTKAQRLAELRQQKPEASPAPQQQVQVKVYGNAAVRRFRAGNIWVMDIWNKQAQGWRVVAVQVTPAAR